MLQTLLTVLLLAAGFVAGLRFRSVRRVAVPLGVLWVAVMATNFITARVAAAGDWVAFVFSAVVVFGLVLGWHGSAPDWPCAGPNAPALSRWPRATGSTNDEVEELALSPVSAQRSGGP
jgi:energy-coupling factor transporter transmembrane protein EcfT